MPSKVFEFEQSTRTVALLDETGRLVTVKAGGGTPRHIPTEGRIQTFARLTESRLIAVNDGRLVTINLDTESVTDVSCDLTSELTKLDEMFSRRHRSLVGGCHLLPLHEKSVVLAYRGLVIVLTLNVDGQGAKARRVLRMEESATSAVKLARIDATRFALGTCDGIVRIVANYEHEHEIVDAILMPGFEPPKDITVDDEGDSDGHVRLTIRTDYRVA